MLNYTMGRSFKQDTASAEWLIAHGLGRPVAITTCVYQPDGKLHQVLPLDVIVEDSNTIKVTFPYAVRGEVRVA